MELLELIDLELKDFTFFCGVILLASFVRGFSGFGFSASSVSLLSFILPPKEIVPIIANGLLINGISYIFWIKALKSISVTSSAVFVFFTPILSLIWILIFFNEQFYLSYIIGGFLVLFSGMYCLKEKSVNI